MQVHPRKCTRTQNVFMSNAQTRTVVFANMSVLIMYACVLRKKILSVTYSLNYSKHENIHTQRIARL